MSYQTRASTQFKRDIKKASPPEIEELNKVKDRLKEGEQLPPERKDHELNGLLKGYRDCHISPDKVLIYRIDKKSNELHFARFGTHSELFGNQKKTSQTLR